MKEMIYFPVQITPGYESAMQAYNHQSQILYNKEYHRTKHANNYDHTKTENYQDIQKHEKARSDYHYQKNYRDTRGKGFSEVETLKQATAKQVQKDLSMKDYTAAAKQKGSWTSVRKLSIQNDIIFLKEVRLNHIHTLN